MLVSLLIFSLITILLYLSSRSLINHLGKLFFRLSRSPETTANILFFLLLPGIFLHEFSHILSAEILRVPTGRLSLKPQLKNGQLKLGSAQIASTDPFRLILIGTAPFLIGTFALWALLKFGFNLNPIALTSINLPSILQISLFKLFAVCYLIFTLSTTMFSSASDLQAAAVPIIFLLIIFGVFRLGHLNIPSSIISSFSNLFLLLSVIFFLTLLLNLLLLVFLKLINYVLH